MRRRLARDMKLSILKSDAKKNRIAPNCEAIKAIKEDPALLSDPELSDSEALELETSSNTIIISAEELKKQLQLAGPLVIVGFLQYSIRMISVVFLGQLRELSLSSATMATSFAGVTGYYFIKRNKKANCRLISFPFFLCALLAVINYYARKYFKGKGLNLEPFPPGYVCPAIDMDRDTRCNIPSPPENPPMLQIPLPNDRATRNPFTPFEGLPHESCKKTNSCPATILLTGNNKTLGLALLASNAYLELYIEFFEANDYSLQFVFYCVYLNLQIAFTFFAAGVFSKVKTASVIAYAMVFGTGLLGSFYFGKKVDDPTFSRGWIVVMELYPGLALYRMLYEFSKYALQGSDTNAGGMKWKDLNDSTNGMKELLIIMVVEWFVLLFVAYYVDQVISSRSGVRKSPLFLLRKFQGQPSSFGKTSLISDESRDFDQAEKADVAREILDQVSLTHDVLHREKVEQLLTEPDPNYAIVCDDLKKVYPAVDGNPPKLAVRGLSLALPRGECFGMLGPNGLGKTSFIKMMIGLTEPSSGTAYVQGLNVSTDMDRIYTSMGVCPQHELKNLKGPSIASTGLWEVSNCMKKLVTEKSGVLGLHTGESKRGEGEMSEQGKYAVEESLKGVNLHSGGVADKEAGKYSGGMKRRLSVAISLIGDPKVVYMDEPSTGLDPASRNELWNAVMKAKRDRAILLTTHSMEEAEHLCDRLGIFVDGSLQCVGNAKQLKARYGGSYVFTITTPSNYEQEVDSMVRRLFLSTNKTYHVSGTQKFELPKHEVRIADVFQAVDNAKNRFTVQAWGLVDTTLEDVFIKVSCGV
ncbi:unnamed protein product [Camellia sinensis]